MQTLAEFLENEKNQEVVLEKIIEALRERGEWGQYGLFAKIGDAIGLSASYVSKSLTTKRPLRENFVIKMADYLKVRIVWLRGETENDYKNEIDDVEHFKKIFQHHLKDFKEEEIEEKGPDTGLKFADLFVLFGKLSLGEMDYALATMRNMRNAKEQLVHDMRLYVNQPSEGE